jgi:hypothetical protein
MTKKIEAIEAAVPAMDKRAAIIDVFRQAGIVAKTAKNVAKATTISTLHTAGVKAKKSANFVKDAAGALKDGWNYDYITMSETSDDE